AFLASRPSTRAAGPPSPTAPDLPDRLRRVGPDNVVVPPSVAQNMGLQTAVVGERVRPMRLPPLQGTLALDPDCLARVHSRFPGEVMSVGADEIATALPTSPRVGDPVHKGDLLAVVWSKDLGEKKSELVDALSKLRADEALLRRLREGERDGSVPARSIWDAERAVEGDRVAVDRAERTLRAWRLTDGEIAAVRAEADRLSSPDAKRIDPAAWARVEVRAPQDGVILEKNVAVGDIVDTSADLFRVGDLSHLVVWAHVYEEDLPLLQSLPQPTRWTVTLPSRPGVAFPGTLDQIRPVIDLNQHTALVTGRVDNPDGSLKVGQFVTVSVELPPPPGEVELPADAVVEDGRESVVFVQPDPGELKFRRTPLQVTRRFRDGVCVRADGGVKPGERVVTSGALLLRDAMDEQPVPRP
ncbi:MAG TPA: efflux RND transporter periplasmic adaptor subunit, partial [Gemmataceae bacterium]|nr:efflux RND transporter periplasmic adaptor subunit [Gemmataceae bacterium]